MTDGVNARPDDGYQPSFEEPARFAALREGVRAVTARFPDAYWRELDRAREYPEAFVKAMTEAGWLGALIPREYGGLGLGLAEAAVILEEVNRQGGNTGPAHAQMYVMGVLLKHGSAEQKRRYLPGVADGSLRFQAFAVTEPDAGTDTTRITTAAVREGDTYRIDGRKIYIPGGRHCDLMRLLARTAPRDAARPAFGWSLFIVERRDAGEAVRLRPLLLLLYN